MMTSNNPGKLGIYGFRNRADYSYEGLSFATSRAVKEDTMWDILSRQGKRVILLGVPQTYPPKPVNGYLVTSFMAPDTESRYTYPPDFKEEISRVVGNYMLDVDNFRTDAKDRLLEQIYEMTEKRFKLARYLVKEKPWEFFMMVEMGIDRIHHGFWTYTDPEHVKYEPGSKYENSIRDYYRYIDEQVGSVLSLLDDQTVVFVVSDHGAKAMRGGICINEWLMQEGYLHILEKPPGVVPLSKATIDWARTMAWADGGYCARVFLNIKGREPQGIIEADKVEAVRNELIEKLKGLEDDKGSNIGTRVFKPEEIYTTVNNIPPDLIVYLGNLDWRSVGSIGLESVHTFENDTGPDDANHDQHGIFIYWDPSGVPPSLKGTCKDHRLVDIAPTVLNLMGIPVPPDMEGRTIELL
jgi:predicted AlkP superfamily phosphohydrolase/phosphomutase